MKARVLPVAEWSRLASVPCGGQIPDIRPEDMAEIVVEDGDRIVARWTVLRMTHLEGLWIDPEYRNAGTGRRLMRLAVQTARQWADKWVQTGAQTDEVRDMLARVGAVKIEMDNYMLPLGGA